MYMYCMYYANSSLKGLLQAQRAYSTHVACNIHTALLVTPIIGAMFKLFRPDFALHPCRMQHQRCLTGSTMNQGHIQSSSSLIADPLIGIEWLQQVASMPEDHGMMAVNEQSLLRLASNSKILQSGYRLSTLG